MKLFAVLLKANSLEMLRELSVFNLDLDVHTAKEIDHHSYSIEGILDEEQIEKLNLAGYKIESKADLSIKANESLKDVSPVNRFVISSTERERSVQGYMTVEEIDSYIDKLQKQYPNFVKVIKLPNLTWEGRTCKAVHLRVGEKTNRIGVLILGNAHAREWGGSDICLHFLKSLLYAYDKKTFLSFGEKRYEFNQVKAILEELDIYLFPEVNPDGKAYSQSFDIEQPDNQNVWWRKNLRPNGELLSKGVDLNRNYDFLWDSGIGTSSEYDSFTYKGPSPFSEPETKNVKYLLDTFNNTRYFIDIHSSGELILYNWGDDNNQSTDPKQNFNNPNYAGMRGYIGDNAYSEFINKQDEDTEIELANRMKEAIYSVRNKNYTVKQAVGLYPTSAACDDYVYSRHITDSSKAKTYSFTIEFGTTFVPPYDEMKMILDDVSSALTELCWLATTQNI